MIEGHTKNTGSRSRHICLISWFYMTLSKWRNLSRPMFFLYPRHSHLLFCCSNFFLGSLQHSVFSLDIPLQHTFPVTCIFCTNPLILSTTISTDFLSQFSVSHYLKVHYLFSDSLLIFLPLLCKSVVFNLGTSWAFLVGQMVKNLPAV